MTKAEREARERALAYFESKASLTPGEVAEQISAAFDSLESVLAEVASSRAAVRATPDEWSAQEVLDHLVETFRPGVDELRCVLAGRRPPGEPIPAALASKAPTLRPWAWLRDEVTRTRRDVLELVRGVAPDFATAARVPIVMVVNVPDGPPLHWVEDLEWKAYTIVSWRLHTIDHLKQIKRALPGRA